MPHPQIVVAPSVPTNRLLRALPSEDAARILTETRTVMLTPQHVLHRRGDILRHVYFPNGAVCSLTMVMSDGRAIEVASVGDDGVVGVAALQPPGVAVLDAVVAASMSTAVEMPVHVLRREMQQCGALSRVVHDYILAFTGLLGQCSACNALHTVRQRCCRWLLATHQRVHGGEFTVSQEALAVVLGARRPTVSVVAADLQKAGLIRYRHGHIEVLDAAGLARESCECVQPQSATVTQLCH